MLVDGGIKAPDIGYVRTTDPADASFTNIRFAGKDNWVKFVPGMEKATAFLKTHRYAAYCRWQLWGSRRWTLRRAVGYLTASPTQMRLARG